MTNRYSPLALAISLNMFLCAVSINTLADDNGLEDIERIIIKSSKREIAIQDAGESISVIMQDELSAIGADNLQDIASRTAGMTLSQPVKNRSTISIRGINTDVGETQLTQDPVGVYINEMPVTGTWAEILQPDLSLYDIDRVEVRLGPQGTLYGSGNIGGAVHIFTNLPAFNEWQSSARIDWADTDQGGQRLRYDAMLNMPLVEDSLAFRIVGSARDDDGWVKDIRQQTTNGFEDKQLRAALLWQPSQVITATLSVLDMQSDPEAGDSWNPERGKFTRSSALNDGRKYDLNVYNLNFDWSINAQTTLTSSTNIRSSSANWFVDIGPFPGIGDFVNQSELDNDALIQEFRLLSNPVDSLEYVLGAYFFEAKTDGPFVLNVLGLQEFVNAIIPNQLQSDAVFLGEFDYSMHERAIFGDMTIALSENWEIAVGLRYFETDARYSQFQQSTFDFNTFAFEALPDVSNKVDDSDWMWRTALSYKPNADRHFYASLSRGVRAGQTNPSFGPSFFDPDDIFIEAGYQSDVLHSIELGMKQSMLDGAAYANLAIFYQDWEDVQVDALRASDSTNYIANAGNAIAKGIEFEIQATFNDVFSGYLAATLQNAEIASISPEQSLLSGALEGDRLPGAVDRQFNAGLKATWTAWNIALMEARVDGRYVGDSTNRLSNFSGLGIPNADFAINDAYTALNASMTANIEAWRISLYVENLTNNDNIILNIGQTQPNPAISLRPRTVGISVDLTF